MNCPSSGFGHSCSSNFIQTLFGSGPAATLIVQLEANKSAQVTAYSTNSFIQAGYNATYSAELRDVISSPIGQAEILMGQSAFFALFLPILMIEIFRPLPSANTGTHGRYPTVGNTISIQAAIQHPLSRGSVKITTNSTFDAPLIDPGYLTHPADIQILRESFKFARKVGQTEPLASILTAELSPGPTVSTDGESFEIWVTSSQLTKLLSHS